MKKFKQNISNLFLFTYLFRFIQWKMKRNEKLTKYGRSEEENISIKSKWEKKIGSLISVFLLI